VPRIERKKNQELGAYTDADSWFTPGRRAREARRAVESV
jgi:hypothetical protein